MKLSPLFQVLRQQFKAYVVPGQNVSFDEMMVLYSSRSSHTIKIKNKPISQGFKIWALCDHGYTGDFLFYSRSQRKKILLFIYTDKLIYTYIYRNG